MSLSTLYLHPANSAGHNDKLTNNLASKPHIVTFALVANYSASNIAYMVRGMNITCPGIHISSLVHDYCPCLLPKSKRDFQFENFQCLSINTIPPEVPQRRSSDQLGLNMWRSQPFASVAQARSRSLDDDMGNVEGVFPRQVNRADSVIVIDEDEDEYQYQSSAISPLTILGAGRVDPFANYPVKMDIAEYWLIDHVNIAQHPTYKVFKESWLPLAMSDPATFHQVLSNIALSVSIVRGQGVILDNPVSAAHNARAVRIVNNRLSDSVESISDGTMTSVLGLTCHSAIKRDYNTWAVHLEGLRNIIELRGGLDVLSNNPKLRLLILWVETAGACRQDITPRFPLPTHLLPVASSTSQAQLPSVRVPTLTLWKSMFPARAALISIFDDVSIVIILSRSPSAKKDSGHFNLLWITPLLHRLLSLPRIPDVSRSADVAAEIDVLGVMQEASRLGIILFVAELRRNCGDLGVPTQVQSRKLRLVLSRPGWCRWALFEPLILWVLFFGALESEAEDRGWFCNSLCVAARNLGIREWKGLVEAVSGLLWIGDVFEERIRRLKGGFDFDKLLGAGRSGI